MKLCLKMCSAIKAIPEERSATAVLLNLFFLKNEDKSHRQTKAKGNNYKQPPRGVLSERSSENTQQISRRTPMPKCDFNKVALQVY